MTYDATSAAIAALAILIESMHMRIMFSSSSENSYSPVSAAVWEDINVYPIICPAANRTDSRASRGCPSRTIALAFRRNESSDEKDHAVPDR